MCCADDRNGHSDNSFIRTNGWTLPFNCLQVTSWLVLLYIGFMFCGVEVLALQTRLWPAAYVCVGAFYAIHVILYLVATTINPADDKSKEQILKRNKPALSFDRNVHRHVIENNYCHICEVSVGSQSKHCSACNKCVAVFDHHCKWLNNCIGQKNYRIFLVTLVSAIIGGIGMLVVSLYVFINAVQGFNNLNTATWWRSSHSLQIIFEVLIGIKMFLVTLSIILLTQLIFFHITLINRGMTTYEYVKNSLSNKEAKEKSKMSRSETPDNGSMCNNMPDIIESPRHDEVPLSIVTTKLDSNSKQKDELPRSALIKPHRTNGNTPSNGVNHDKDNGTGDTLSKNKNSNGLSSSVNYGYESDDHSESPNANIITTSSISVNNSNNVNTTAHIHNGQLPHSIPDSSGEAEKVSGQQLSIPTQSRKKRRRKKKIYASTEDFIPRPLPQPLSTVLETPGPSSGAFPPTSYIPSVRDPIDWRSSSEDLSKMKGRKLPPLSTSSSITSLSSCTVSDV